MEFSPLIVEALDKERGIRGLFRIAEPFHAADPVRGEIVVPVDYVTDFASIPWLFMWLLPTSGRCAKPAVLHDYVNARGVTEDTREQRRWSTGIFNRALKAQGVWAVKRWAMVAFVTLFTLPDLYL